MRAIGHAGVDFDTPVDRIGTHSVKWDAMEAFYGVPATDGIAMWVADMDFRPPQCVQTALENMLAHGVYGYYGDDAEYLDAIRWWMKTRHGWDVRSEWISTTHGLVNGISLCLQAFSALSIQPRLAVRDKLNKPFPLCIRKPLVLISKAG